MKNVFLFIWLSLMTANAFGQAGNCLDFDGTDDYVSIADHADFKFGTNNFTIELWFKLPSGFSTETPTLRYPVLISKGTFTTSGGFILYVVQ